MYETKSALHIGDQNKAYWGMPEGYPDGDKQIDPSFLPPATLTTLGAVKQALNISEIDAAPTAEQFNNLLTALENAGIIEAE